MDIQVLTNALKVAAIHSDNLGVPPIYSLGATPEIDIYAYGRDTQAVALAEITVSIQDPLGGVIVVSGQEIQTASGYYYYIYRPEVRGWYGYVIWVKGLTGLEATSDPYLGFEVVDNF